MDIRRRGWDYQHDKDRSLGGRQREWEMEGEGRESPSNVEFDESGLNNGQGHPGFPPGWGGAPEKSLSDDVHHFGTR